MLDAVFPEFAPHPFISAVPVSRIRSLAAFKSSRSALEAALGFALPSSPKRISVNGAEFLWNGKNQWLVLGEIELPAQHAAITEQGDGLFLLSISGPQAIGALKKLLQIDIARFAEDDVAITAAAHIGVRIWRNGDAYILACFRSFAVALHHALLDAAAGRG